LSSTLFIRRTPRPTKNVWSFKLPIKHYIAKRFYDHDGSCGGGRITIGQEHLDWFEGILIAAQLSETERKEFEDVVDILREGDTIDVWFEC
jgi:hypothetical protein